MERKKPAPTSSQTQLQNLLDKAHQRRVIGLSQLEAQAARRGLKTSSPQIRRSDGAKAGDEKE